MTQNRVSLKAPAKINLYLRITGRREDGYHYLATLMQKISLFDYVDLEKSRSGITLSCPESDLPENSANIAFRAAEIFFDRFADRLQGKDEKAGVVITLHKNIPVAAGLGGGSSDAAAVLRGLDELFGTCCREKELLELALNLGADVPFLFADLASSWATGIGDCLHQALPLSGYKILIVNPGYSVSTQWVYENFTLTAGQNINNLKSLQNTISGQRKIFSDRSIKPEELVNDLEQVTASKHPEIDLLKDRLLQGGAVAAMMSGSGPTVFGLYHASELEKALACMKDLQSDYQSVFLVDPLQS